MAPRHLLIFAIFLSACHLTLQSPSRFSLQPAVEALNEREIELARDELQNSNLEEDNDSDDFVDYGFERGQHASNKAKAHYLSRSNPDYDDYLAYRKRTLFRKRGSSVFRERSRLPSQHHQQQPQLAEKFLKAIEDEREREREDEYREALHNMWNRYQDDESAIEQELFNDNENNNVESDYPVNYEDISKKKKKRQRGDAEVAPVYWEDKRSMPMLPWLPASRKKRFPVTKRSPKGNENEISHSRITREGNDKISQDLRGIFGVNSVVNEGNDMKKKKRSMDMSNHGDGIKIEPDRQQHSSMVAPHHSHDSGDDKKRNTKKRDLLYLTEDEDSDSDPEQEDDDDYEEHDDDSDDDKKKKKKKREAKKSLEVVGAESFPEKKGAIKKKSVQWSKIFGIDRKKKRSNSLNLPRFNDLKKRGEYDYEDYYDIVLPDSYYEDSEEPEVKTKRSRNEDKLDAMDRKLKAMKNLIIEDTARYYSHHDENLSPSDVKEMRNEMNDRLAAAYSLDKMRRAIARLKQSLAFQKSVDKNLLGSQVRSEGEFNEDDDKKKAKRVAIKKEKVEFDNNGHEIETPLKKIESEERRINGLNDEDEENKKKKKRSQKKSVMTNDIDEEDDREEGAPMSEGYMGGGRVFEKNCPLLDVIEKRCRSIDLLSGDSHHNLLEACGAHQLCYLCGDSEVQCDYGYLYEIQDTCGNNSKCKLNGAQALKVLRTFSGPKVGPRECVRNPCLNSALRSLGY